MERVKGVVSERMPEDFLLRRHRPAQISCALQFLASDELVSGYFHLTPWAPLPFGEGESESAIRFPLPVPHRWRGGIRISHMLSPSGSPLQKGEVLGERSLRAPGLGGLSRLRLQHTALNLGLRLVGVDWIEVRHGSPGAPSKFFSDIVGASFGLEINFVRTGIGLDAASYFLAGRNYERVVAAGADAHRVFTAGNRRQDQRRRVAV